VKITLIQFDIQRGAHLLVADHHAGKQQPTSIASER
jgi:hypothetical protein